MPKADACNSCGIRLIGRGSTSFPCPSCAHEHELGRCPQCRDQGVAYECPSCHFVGP